VNDLNGLQFFVQVARTRSFTHAARHLRVPKSSVSRAIRRLESRLGVRLIERTTRSVALTEAGELYLESCHRVLEAAEQADLAVNALLAKPRGRLRIGAPVAFARSILAPILGDFLAAYPDLQFQLELLHGSGPASDDLDLVVRAGPLEDSASMVKPLMRIRVAAYASPAYLKNHPAPATPADLRDHHCVVTSCSPTGEAAGYALWRLAQSRSTSRSTQESKEVRVLARTAVPDPSINMELALAGVGIALLSQTSAAAAVREGRLVRLLPDWEPEPVQLYAVYPSRLSASPKVRVFLEFLRDRFGSHAELGPPQPTQPQKTPSTSLSEKKIRPASRRRSSPAPQPA
jgi:DNA-binding transcriptional LysR family regulator